MEQLKNERERLKDERRRFDEERQQHYSHQPDNQPPLVHATVARPKTWVYCCIGWILIVASISLSVSVALFFNGQQAPT
jgi:hypothetical protein